MIADNQHTHSISLLVCKTCKTGLAGELCRLGRSIYSVRCILTSKPHSLRLGVQRRRQHSDKLYSGCRETRCRSTSSGSYCRAAGARFVIRRRHPPRSLYRRPSLAHVPRSARRPIHLLSHFADRDLFTTFRVTRPFAPKYFHLA